MCEEPLGEDAQTGAEHEDCGVSDHGCEYVSRRGADRARMTCAAWHSAGVRWSRHAVRVRREEG